MLLSFNVILREREMYCVFVFLKLDYLVKYNVYGVFFGVN